MRSRCTDRADTKSASLTGSVRDANISRRRADSEVSGCSRKYLGISHTATATSLLSILRNLPVARSRPVAASDDSPLSGDLENAIRHDGNFNRAENALLFDRYPVQQHSTLFLREGP